MARDGIPLLVSINELRHCLGDRKIVASKLREELDENAGRRSNDPRQRWGWGRFRYAMKTMIADGSLYFKFDGEGRKVLSLTPFEDEENVVKGSPLPQDVSDLVDICALQNDIIIAVMKYTLLDFKDEIENDMMDQEMMRKKVGKKIIDDVLKSLNVSDEALERVMNKINEIGDR